MAEIRISLAAFFYRFGNRYDDIHSSDSSACRDNSLHPTDTQDAAERRAGHSERCIASVVHHLWRCADGDTDRIVLGCVRNVKSGTSILDIRRTCPLWRDSPAATE